MMLLKQFHVPLYLEASSLDCNLTLTVYIQDLESMFSNISLYKQTCV